MNIQQLKYFIEITQTRNLSSAARNLFVTQPTLSLSIKKLESELNTSLFVHTDEPFQLTTSGAYLYKKGVDIVEQFDQLIEDIHQMNDRTEKKRIKIGLTTLFSVQFMKEISTFLQTHPYIDLNIVQDGSPELQTKLKNKEIDIGLISFPNNHPEQINIEPLETTTKGYNVYVVVPENNPLSKKHELTFNDLKGQRFSSLSTKYMIGRLLLERSRFFGYEPNIILQNDDLQVLIHSLQKNDSICLLPIEYEIVGKSDNVKWIPLKDRYAHFPIGIALRKDFNISSDIEDFIQAIKQN